MSTDASPRLRRPTLIGLVRAAGGFLLPAGCLACGERPVHAFRRGGVCEPCWGEVVTTSDPRCEHCGQPIVPEDPGVCGRCLIDPPEFQSLSCTAAYRGAARSILLAFKFAGADYLAPHLARLMAKTLRLPDGIHEVVAVPALPSERRRRDHAAELLGAAVARQIGLPFARGRLAKVRPTRRQSGLPLAQRTDNVRGAFRAVRPVPRRILLVDDVATSCATVRACTRALARAGADCVDVWCFARAEREDELRSGA